jgi:hypothetical protein
MSSKRGENENRDIFEDVDEEEMRAIEYEKF